jgi:tRNA threonylcarbamoyladenosine biosynthesis protein TsaE
MYYEKVYTLNEIDHIANYIISLLDKYDLFLFFADIGIGKTTLIKRILKNVGINDNINSPTFNYMNIYKLNSYTFCHFDLYRLSSYLDFVNMGFDDFISGNKSLIEWPEIIIPYINNRFNILTINLYYNDFNSRLIKLDSL